MFHPDFVVFFPNWYKLHLRKDSQLSVTGARMGGAGLSAQGPLSPSWWRRTLTPNLGWRGRCFFSWSWSPVRRCGLAHALWVIGWMVWMDYPPDFDISCQLKAVNPEAGWNFFPNPCWSGTSAITGWRICCFVQVSLGISIIMFNSIWPFLFLAPFEPGWRSG